MKQLLKGVISLCLAAATSGCIVSRPAINGRVIDAKTHQPVAGANVVAHWHLKYYFLEAHEAGELQVLETVTDADGKFHIQKWTRVRSPFARGSIYSSEDPELIIFKQGYRLKRARNFPKEVEDLMGPLPAEGEHEVDSVRPNDWQGRDFKLRALVADEAKDLRDAFDLIHHIVDSSDVREQCFWAKASAALNAIDLAYRRIDRNRALLNSYRSQIEECGQGKAFGW